MWRDIDGNQQIARAMARRRLALPLQPDLLTGRYSGGNLDIEFLAGRQSDAFLDALHRFFQRHRHGDAEIEIERYSAGIELEGRASAGPRATRRGTAEHAVEDVLETAAGAGPAGAECVGLETAPPARVAAGKTLEARLALGVDFAAVELLAPVLVADDLVGRIDLGKPRRGFRIVLVAVRG